MSGPAPSAAPAAQPIQSRTSQTDRGSSSSAAVSTAPTSMSRYPQPIQLGMASAVMLP
jgi:hypothetical protein